MSVIGFEQGDRFIYTVHKRLNANPNLDWRNTYEFVATDDGNITDLTALALALSDFERTIHYNGVFFTTVEIATWEPDSVPYDPTSFLSFPVGESGNLDPGEDGLVANNVCLHVARVPASGRYGHIFYRGCMVMADIAAPAGDWILTAPEAMFTRISDGLSSTGFDDYVTGAGPVLHLAMVNKTGSNTRQVVAIGLPAVSTVPTKHQWFNRE